MQALKMMVRWLLGQGEKDIKSATSTLRLLHTMISHDGDLMERGKIKYVHTTLCFKFLLSQSTPI